MVFLKACEHFGPEKSCVISSPPPSHDNSRVLESSQNAFSGIPFPVKWLYRVAVVKKKVIQNESLSKLTDAGLDLS